MISHPSYMLGKLSDTVYSTDAIYLSFGDGERIKLYSNLSLAWAKWILINGFTIALPTDDYVLVGGSTDDGQQELALAKLSTSDGRLLAAKFSDNEVASYWYIDTKYERAALITSNNWIQFINTSNLSELTQGVTNANGIYVGIVLNTTHFLFSAGFGNMICISSLTNST